MKQYDDVAGAFDRRRDDDDFKVKLEAFIDSEDFCEAVRRCLINDLVAAAEDDRDDRRKHKRRDVRDVRDDRDDKRRDDRRRRSPWL
ncbi:hypothetical protein [Mesobacillus harenae]|uniref:hypothetical protein n=1 Tax=Mesobacillus harenae TaxID=2213203 RepID=UPI0015808D02|nr:hypothetical protein [Mesobacillus harenae]